MPCDRTTWASGCPMLWPNPAIEREAPRFLSTESLGA
jgi:hypothetical protein